MNKVVIRTDASIWIGSGHVMRCLVLADGLTARGYEVCFSCLPQPGDMISFIQSRGYEVIRLTAPKVFKEPRHDTDYHAWLQKSPQEDAQDFLRKVTETDWVITDHYAIDALWHDRVKAPRKCRLLCIDDLVRRHHADVVVDQTLGRQAGEYSTHGPALTGTDYALLGPQFATLRAFAEKRARPASPVRVLISMGGIDLPNASLAVLKALVGHVDARFTVLLSPRSPNYQMLSDWCAGHDHVQHIDFVADMASMMLDHDVAIGAPGSTSWERACLGLPSIIIPLADNQKEICEQLVASGASLSMALTDIETQLVVSYHKLLAHWEVFHHRNLQLCDGQGAERVINEIIRLDNESNHNLQ